MFTSNLPGAGTNGWAYIAIYGSYGWTDAMLLDEPHYNDNEAGHMDVHHYNASDVGRPLKVMVWHLQSRDQWHLNKVGSSNCL